MLLVSLILCAVVSLLQGYIGAYYFQIIIYIGINIILASSLNLINGFAGQFSLGHAGFMAIGAYTSSIITASLHLQPGLLASNFIFVGALLAGGLMASFFGLLVGIPSLRLKGDYLAITTIA